MSISCKRILSLGTSHYPIPYMAEIGCRTSTQTQNTWFGPRQIGTHSEHRYYQRPARKQLLIKMRLVILLGLVQHRRHKKSYNIQKNLVGAIHFLTHIQYR